MSIKWMKKWMKMHYFESYNQQQKPEYDESLDKEIEPISNDELVIDKNHLNTHQNPNKNRDYRLKPGVRMNVDFQIVDEDTWRFFQTKYGGIEIKRFYQK